MVNFPLTSEGLQLARAKIREVTDEVPIENKQALELLDGTVELAVLLGVNLDRREWAMRAGPFAFIASALSISMACLPTERSAATDAPGSASESSAIGTETRSHEESGCKRAPD